MDYDVAKHNARVYANTGQIPDNITTDKHVKLLKQAGLWDSCVFFGDTNRGVKKDENDKVSKLYDVKGYTDLHQDIGAKQPIYISDGGLHRPEGFYQLRSDDLAEGNPLRETFVNYSISFWVKIINTEAYAWLFGRGIKQEADIVPFNISYEKACKIIRINTANSYSDRTQTREVADNNGYTRPMEIGDLYHVVVAFNLSNAGISPGDIYIDGEGRPLSAGDTYHILNSDVPLHMFSNQFDQTNYYEEVNVWLPQVFNKTLSAEDVQFLYKNIRPEGV